MYGQIPTKGGGPLQNVVKEGNVFVIKKFLYNKSRACYRAVESPFMVQFTRFTVVQEKPGTEDDYPFCTYSLTAFADVPSPSNGPAERFIGE